MKLQKMHQKIAHTVESECCMVSTVVIVWLSSVCICEENVWSIAQST